ncbi:Myotubularin-like phosphatase domain [Trinorchestia longiramus]|nr:Myotubularin-like phosphatase domain [Trinorchestia longiramus]
MEPEFMDDDDPIHEHLSLSRTSSEHPQPPSPPRDPRLHRHDTAQQERKTDRTVSTLTKEQKQPRDRSSTREPKPTTAPSDYDSERHKRRISDEPKEGEATTQTAKPIPAMLYRSSIDRNPIPDNLTQKCVGVVNCRGNYNKENKRHVFCLPKEESERQKWLDVIPPHENFVVDPDKFFICEIHWGTDPPLIKLHGGSMRPEIPPSIFNVPASCLPSPKPAPRPIVYAVRRNCALGKDQVLRETFDKVQTLQQKNVFLLVDEVQIRPTVSFSGGLLSGMAFFRPLSSVVAPEHYQDLTFIHYAGAPKLRESLLVTPVITRQVMLCTSSNTLRGGAGLGAQEGELHYPNWRRVHKPIDRRHTLLESLAKLMDGANDTSSTQDKWLSRVEASGWMANIKDTLDCACLVAQCLHQVCVVAQCLHQVCVVTQCLHQEGASVLVHDTAGQDAALQVSALAQIILNQDCRTVRGSVFLPTPITYLLLSSVTPLPLISYLLPLFS